MKATMASIIRIAAMLAFGAALGASAQVPQKLSFQGYLTSSTGSPVSATLPITFSLWDAPTLGTQAWAETQAVTVTGGLYHVILGNVVALPPAFDKPYYLQIQVNADAAMTPRQPLASVAYAATAATTSCQTNDLMPCYSGPAGTLGVGLCKAGRRVCDAVTKTFGACTGQVVPVPEVADGLDNDCNGVVDNL